MWTYQAERLVPGELSMVQAGVAALVDTMWRDRSRMILDDIGDLFDTLARQIPQPSITRE